jgi:multiple sugar transport system substrate-binding protein
MNEKRKAISRREFLKVAGLGVAAAGVSTLVAQPALTQTALAAGIRPRTRKQAKEIRVLVVGDPFQFALEKVLDDFTAETGIKVNLESLSYDALSARLVTSFVSQTPDADVVNVDNIWSGQFFDNGWIIALDDYIKGDPDVNLKDFIPEVLYSFNIWRGRFVSLPVAAYCMGVLYRTDVFEKAGLEPPPTDPDKAAGWTWDKYLEIVKQLQGMEMDGTKLYGTVIVGAQPVPIVHMYSGLAASRGVRWFKRFPEAPWDFEPTINSPENIESLKFYKALYELSPAESINYIWFDAGTRFAQGDIGMYFWWSPYFYLANNDGYMSGKPSKIVGKFDIALLPKLRDDAPQIVSLGGHSWGIPSTSRKQDEAWQFIKWSCSAKTQKKMGLVPDYNYQFADFSRVSLYQDTELKAVYPFLDTQLKLMLQGNGKISRPPMPLYSTLEGIYGLYLNKTLAGVTTPEESLKEADALFRNALSGNFMLPYNRPDYDDTLENAKKLIESLAG